MFSSVFLLFFLKLIIIIILFSVSEISGRMMHHKVGKVYHYPLFSAIGEVFNGEGVIIFEGTSEIHSCVSYNISWHLNRKLDI